MILTMLLVSFCLLISFCTYEALFLLKLISRLKRHKRYVMEFMSIQTASGLSMEKYVTKQLIPGYLSILFCVFLTVLTMMLCPYFPFIVKVSSLILGGIACIWSRFYNKVFLNLLWERVLIP